MNAKELHDALSANPTSGNELAALAAANMLTILRALSLLAAAEANDGTTPETDNPNNIDTWRATKDRSRRLERERNGLAAEVLRMVRLLNDNPNAYCSDIVACLNDEAKADKVKP